MKSKSQKSMYKLLRELNDVQGTARMTLLSLNAFIESIRQLKCRREEFDGLYHELADIVKKSQPNIIPLMHLLEFFELDMENRIDSGMDMDEVKTIAIDILEQKISMFKRHAACVTENGLSYIQDRDVIIVHSASTVVTNILIHAKEKLNRSFKVVILDLNTERTRQTVQALKDADIEYLVTPDHNLSHHIDAATKMFVGAMTITADRKILAPVGTAGTVSHCRLHGVKVHLFANTLHFSHRNSTAQNIFQASEAAQIGKTDFAMSTHSHDMVGLDFIDHIVTEIGEVSADGLLSVPPVPLSRLKAGEIAVGNDLSPAMPIPEMSHA